MRVKSDQLLLSLLSSLSSQKSAFLSSSLLIITVVIFATVSFRCHHSYHACSYLLCSQASSAACSGHVVRNICFTLPRRKSPKHPASLMLNPPLIKTRETMLMMSLSRLVKRGEECVCVCVCAHTFVCVCVCV